MPFKFACEVRYKTDDSDEIKTISMDTTERNEVQYICRAIEKISNIITKKITMVQVG